MAVSDQSRGPADALGIGFNPFVVTIRQAVEHSAHTSSADGCAMTKRRKARLPRVEVTELRSADGNSDLAFWCPWCEAPHFHGGCGGGGAGDGPTSAHCAGDRRSPFLTTGVDLVTTRVDIACAAIEPAVPMIRRRPFRAMVGFHGDAFQALALRSILGVSAAAARRSIVETAVGEAVYVLVAGVSWRVYSSAREAAGSGFLGLIEALYGITPGVAAVRLLEAVAAETFDAPTALAIQIAIDDWVRRGSLARGRR